MAKKFLDAQGLTYLISKLDDYPTNEILSAVIDGIDEIKADKTNATTTEDGLMSSEDKNKLDGVATGANNYSLPTASSSTLGGVKVDNTTITIDANGIISATNGGSGGSSPQIIKLL